MSAPWHANFPVGKSNPPEISAAELAALTGPGKEYIVVDVRRTDIDVSNLVSENILPFRLDSEYPGRLELPSDARPLSPCLV